jgi:hypothetical protein
MKTWAIEWRKNPSSSLMIAVAFLQSTLFPWTPKTAAELTEIKFVNVTT